MSKLEYLQEMINNANAVRKNAYAPISNFPVGACIRTSDDKFFVGCNTENASFSMTICAESAAVVSMIAAGARQIKDLVVIAEMVEECPPCGACRQRIYEFSQPETKIHLCTKEGVLRKTITMQELLTEPFKPLHIKSLYEE